jgi:4-amino-4-deoxy-L-arabinose transferase-like glycosyltransferase
MSMHGTLAADVGETHRSRLSNVSGFGQRALLFFQPWRRRALLLIALIAAFCNFYQLQANGYANLYYAAAIRSMMQSWHNFFFVSYDPGGFVSVDKPPLGFWIQTISAKIFGFSGFSILLPEALAGVASVLVLYVLVRRAFGDGAGLLAALALAITPISVVTNRNNTIDSLLVLTSLLAAWAVLKATEQGSLRWLLVGGLLVGLGFNIKMLEAWLILPALALVYLLGAPLRWRTRLLHLVLAGVVMLVISLAWVVAVDLTPASARPYVGSSQTNSEMELAFGYNGIQRLTGALFNRGGPASSTTSSGFTFPTGAAGNGPGGAGENGQVGFFRLLNAQLGPQVSWLLPFAILGFLAAALTSRGTAPASETESGGGLAGWARRLRSNPEARKQAHLNQQQQSLTLWGMWVLTQGVFFSVAGFFHTYYLSMLAPGIAALVGIGAVALWRAYQQGGRLGWLLPITLVVTAATQVYLLANYPDYRAWIAPIALSATLIAAAVLVWLRLQSARATEGTVALASGHEPMVIEENDDFAVERVEPMARPQSSWSLGLLRRAAPWIVAGAMLALLVAPAAWVGASLANPSSSNLPVAGPRRTASFTGAIGAGGGFAGRGSSNGGFPGAGGFPGGAPPNGGNGSFTPPSGGGAGTFTPPTGTSGATDDAATGLQVNSDLIAYLEAHMTSGSYLFATSSSMTASPYIIATGKPVMALGGFSGSDPILTVAQLQALVADGTVRYFLLGSGGVGFGGGGLGGSSSATSWVTNTCTAVSSSEWSGSGSSSQGGGSQLYDCVGKS